MWSFWFVVICICVVKFGCKEGGCVYCFGKFEVVVKIVGFGFGYCIVWFIIVDRLVKV